MLCFTVYFTRVNVTSVSVKQPFIWWRHSIDFQSFQNPNLFKHQTLREKQTACTKLSGDQSICLLCAFFHLKGGCGGILPNFWAVWLAGGGIAVDLQFHIFSYLYTPDSANLDLAALGRSASALKLVTQSWTQVDTPSVASPISDHGR